MEYQAHYHLHKLKIVKNTHGEVSFLVKLVGDFTLKLYLK